MNTEQIKKIIMENVEADGFLKYEINEIILKALNDHIIMCVQIKCLDAHGKEIRLK